MAHWEIFFVASCCAQALILNAIRRYLARLIKVVFPRGRSKKKSKSLPHTDTAFAVTEVNAFLGLRAYCARSSSNTYSNSVLSFKFEVRGLKFEVRSFCRPGKAPSIPSTSSVNEGSFGGVANSNGKSTLLQRHSCD